MKPGWILGLLVIAAVGQGETLEGICQEGNDTLAARRLARALDRVPGIQTDHTGGDRFIVNVRQPQVDARFLAIVTCAQDTTLTLHQVTLILIVDRDTLQYVIRKVREDLLDANIHIAKLVDSRVPPIFMLQTLRVPVVISISSEDKTDVILRTWLEFGGAFPLEFFVDFLEALVSPTAGGALFLWGSKEDTP